MKKLLIASLMAICAMPTMAQNADGVDTVFTATSNPFVKYKHLGDPAALVDGDRLYLYAGHDQCPPNR